LYAEENPTMIDPYTTWISGCEHKDALLREAEIAQIVADLPAQPSALRLTLSRWLYALATRLEPSAVAFRQARRA
jgi:hypothetical protein